ncbi:MAG: 3-hydroxyacyl-CoA dehydrogenase NAD-binding domain-containing protein [Firmicutes bacterium]|uniref:3-hydroxybutyryl-CoA dehydrogenase n=1 Tax=Melghirimyces thermohalophilus TaxID=1236220 RepID=A0A1G6IRF3_9BACL|nr:3-hydroxyacyl-CoA dehydrogenase NAD-binding domain-containing protein [Melghirimyces thermohalophilus]MDA8351599.1 3-hydroxyacyl-CoA dehydrogenase NAD-binding domain-containing protein [Bacillota bacterium]SDC09058.1 3-hydroxybutyryl-CoA dehydrogenase [Melghirimyces thermohalophilus]
MKEVRQIGVIGAGVMGKGIVYQAAVQGFSVCLYDADPEALEQAIPQLESLVARQVKKERITSSEGEATLDRIQPADSLEALASCDFIIEAVVEDLEVKQKLFRQLDAIFPDEVVLATNTSAKSITEIAAVTSKPERVIGMHFFNPVHRMKLVEVVRGLQTSDPVVEQTLRVGRELGKETARIQERPGFATSRISALVGNEAFYMLMEGVGSAEEIDRAIKLGLNHPMGPFELGDLVGWDTRLKVLQYLHETLGEKFRPCPLLVQYVQAGRLGRKTRQGVYRYDEQGRRLQQTEESP